jgi:hypothetical protein
VDTNLRSTNAGRQTVVHNPELMGPHTETLGLVAPGDWVDFFRYVGEAYAGVIIPEHDERDLKKAMVPKLMAAKEDFDVHFVRDYQPPAVGEWLASENTLPGALEPYFLRANTGPRWMLGGVMSRPFINASQCSGKFSITSIESSKVYETNFPSVKFPTVDHCFCVQEGVLKVKLDGEGEAWNEVREGQTLFIAAGSSFSLSFGSRYVKAITFTNGPGIEHLIHTAGSSYAGFVLPDKAEPWDQSRFEAACQELGVAHSS